MSSDPTRLPGDLRIVEGLMTTLDADGVLNIAPMGPMVDEEFTRFTLRPFTSSTTYKNLKATGHGVFHVTDDALMIARGAIGKLTAAHTSSDAIPTRPATKINGVVLTGACRYHELVVEHLDDSQERTVIQARSVHRESLRDFFGFSRAKHAVIEAAILATRLHLTGTSLVLEEYERLAVMVQKTGGPAEHQAMQELADHVMQAKVAQGKVTQGKVSPIKRT